MDAVNKPKHYVMFPDKGIEARDIIEKAIENSGLTGGDAYNFGCALKYLLRIGRKDGVKQDTLKSINYLNRLAMSFYDTEDSKEEEEKNRASHTEYEDYKYSTPMKEKPLYKIGDTVRLKGDLYHDLYKVLSVIPIPSTVGSPPTFIYDLMSIKNPWVLEVSAEAFLSLEE